MNNFEEICDTLDAAIFTGDVLMSEENRKILTEYLDRWVGELKRAEDFNKQMKEEMGQSWC